MMLKNMMESWPSNIGQVKGNNREIKYWPKDTKMFLLKHRMPELMAFSRDRDIDMHLLLKIALDCLELGRVPDLSVYGLEVRTDDVRAITHFMADVFLNIEDLEFEGDSINESTVSANIGPFLNSFNKIAKRGKIRPFAARFDIPDEEDLDRTTEKKYKFPLNNKIKSGPLDDKYIKAYQDHTLDGVNRIDKSLDVLKAKIRRFRDKRNKSV